MDKSQQVDISVIVVKSGIAKLDHLLDNGLFIIEVYNPFLPFLYAH
jgi:hypothetical protein